MTYGRIISLCLLLFAAGCSSGNSANSVSGTITYQGTPLNSGMIYFTIDRGKATRSARIESDGTYVVEDLPAGQAQIAVIVPPAFQAPDDPKEPGYGYKPPDTVANPVEIPKLYSETATSGLTLAITSGQQSHDIDLD